MKSETDKLLKRHPHLVQSDMVKVTSHVQRPEGDWIINTIMVEDHDIAFRYKRKKQYRSLQGARVNITYYPATIDVAGIEIEIMNVVRIKRS